MKDHERALFFVQWVDFFLLCVCVASLQQPKNGRRFLLIASKKNEDATWGVGWGVGGLKRFKLTFKFFRWVAGLLMRWRPAQLFREDACTGRRRDVTTHWKGTAPSPPLQFFFHRFFIFSSIEVIGSYFLNFNGHVPSISCLADCATARSVSHDLPSCTEFLQPLWRHVLPPPLASVGGPTSYSAPSPPPSPVTPPASAPLAGRNDDKDVAAVRKWPTARRISWSHPLVAVAVSGRRRRRRRCCCPSLHAPPPPVPVTRWVALGDAATRFRFLNLCCFCESRGWRSIDRVPQRRSIRLARTFHSGPPRVSTGAVFWERLWRTKKKSYSSVKKHLIGPKTKSSPDARGSKWQWLFVVVRNSQWLSHVLLFLIVWWLFSALSLLDAGWLRKIADPTGLCCRQCHLAALIRSKCVNMKKKNGFRGEIELEIVELLSTFFFQFGWFQTRFLFVAVIHA